MPLELAGLHRSVGKLPSAGPYYVAEHEPDRLLALKRNPNYHGSRPRRPRQIQVQIGGSPAQVFDDVLAGRADYTYEIPPSAAAERELAARDGPASDAARDGQAAGFSVNPALALGALVLNTSRPLFADARLRKAVNYAIDRRALAHIGHFRFSGDLPAIPTAQYLPPMMPGASRTPLYPLGGDLRAARRLRPDERDRRRLHLHARQCRRQAQVIGSNLRHLGLDVDIREFPYVELFDRASRPGEPYDILTAWELADYADPADYLNDFLETWYRPDPQLSAKLERAAPQRLRARARIRRALGRDRARRRPVRAVRGRRPARLLLRARWLPGLSACLPHGPRRAMPASLTTTANRRRDDRVRRTMRSSARPPQGPATRPHLRSVREGVGVPLAR